MRKRNPDGLSKLYQRYPTNEEIERDLGSHQYDACAAIQELRDYLLACHRDGLFKGTAAMPAEKVLDKLEDIVCYIADDGQIEFELDLPKLPKELTGLLQTRATA
jgi:hypothetical protein